MPNKRRTEGRQQRLGDLATRQHGVVSAAQLRVLGFARSTVDGWTAAGRLQRVHRGVYAVGHCRLTWNGFCFAALLACAPARASHSTAGWLLGILRTRPGTFDLTTPTRRHSKPQFRLHFSRLQPADCDSSEGIPITALPRTLLDLAAALPDSRLDGALERAEERDLLDLHAIEELLGRAGHHPGVGKLRRALEIYRPDPALTRSRVEKRFLALVRRAGLPAPATNFSVGGFELDAYWAAERFAVELDVYGTHGSAAAFERDRQRQDDLLLLGVQMIRVTGLRLKREPAATIARVAEHLERRRRELA